MKKSNWTDLGPKIADPTEKEIAKTIEKVKDNCDVVIQRDDAINFYKLTEELGWWKRVEKGSKDPRSFTDKMSKEVREFIKNNYGDDVSLDEAARQAKETIARAIPIEKEIIKKEIAAIIEKYR